jgi:hypothetical protein
MRWDVGADGMALASGVSSCSFGNLSEHAGNDAEKLWDDAVPCCWIKQGKARRVNPV